MQSLKHIDLFYEITLVPVYIILIFIIGRLISIKYQNKIPDYKFLYKAILFKLIGVLMFGLVYIFYYEGGDTLNYYVGAKSLSNLLENDFSKGFSILFNTESNYNSWYSFPRHDHPPYYMWRDPNTFSVSRYTVPIYFLASKSFFVTSMLTSCFSLIGIWKIFRLFNIIYPGNSKVFAYLILYLPTLIFWGGGIMKDSYVLGATCWISYNFYMVFIKRQKLLLNLFFFIMNLYLIITIKSYVVLSLIPGMLIWINSAYLKNISSKVLKVFTFPILFVTISLIGLFFYSNLNLSSMMGVYGNVDTAIKRAQIIQDDLLREEQYGGNNYKLGELDGSFSGLLVVAPMAIFTALFRPLFWEIGSPTMIFSVIENSILLVFFILLLLRTSPLKLLYIMFREPFLIYCFIFSILFAFGVGIAGTNFGALVRYKTPLVPFFFSMIYIVYKLSKSDSSN